MELFQQQIFRGLVMQQIQFAQSNIPMKPNSGEVNKTIVLPHITENLEIIDEKDSAG